MLLLISSERGQIYSFATPKLQPILVNENSKQLIEQCLNAPDPMAPMAIAAPPMPVDPSQGMMPPGMMPPGMVPQGMPEHMMAAGGLVAMPGAVDGAPQMHGGYVIGPDGQPHMMQPPPSMPQ